MTMQECFEAFCDNTYGPREGFEPRSWQMECFQAYMESVREHAKGGDKAQHSYCIYAGTGSGKTKAAGLLASMMLNTGAVGQVVFVCPNRSIRAKAQKDLKRWFGIILARFHKTKHKDGVPRMQQGYILTYGALISDPTLHRRLCQGVRTLVIFDEIHHLGDSGGWGESASEAFGNVPYVIALTGTPYRSDNRPIPFVTYEDTGSEGIKRFSARPPGGFTYNLGRAVAEAICRKPSFIFHDGTCVIRFGDSSGERRVTFEDTEVSQEVASLRLRGAVQYSAPARRNLLAKALAECKKDRRKVIIFLGGDTESDLTPTEDATSYLPAQLQELGITPDEYDTVTGDDESAQKKIEEFGVHPTKWILVSINMVSEGTDIPELSAAIFLTSITAKQTTIQRIGRVLRSLGPDDPHRDSHIFMFKDPNLFTLADEIENEVRSEVNLLRKAREAADGAGGDKAPRRAEVVNVDGGNLAVVKFGGRTWPAGQFEEARQHAQRLELPGTYTDTIAVLLMKEAECHACR